jgi:purine-nucleoside phosphorylase
MNLQNNFLNEKSVLSIEELVAWKKDKNIYRINSIPETAIICAGFHRNKYITRLKSKLINGIKGLHSISKNKNYIISSNFGDGAPELISICEELRCLGVKNFIFIGVAGIISQRIKEGECIVVEKAFSGVGITSYYSQKDEFELKENSWSKVYLDKTNSIRANCFSTDAPFRETDSLLNHYRDKKADLIEMECAGLFAFSEFHSVNLLCFLFGADKLTSDWNPPKNYQKIIQNRQKLIDQLINI